MTKFSKISAAVALMALGASAQASFLIDNFTIQQNPPLAQLSDNTVTPPPASTSTLGVSNYQVNMAGGVSSTVTGQSTANIIGGERDMMVSKSRETGIGAARPVEAFVDGGSFEFNSPSNAAGFAILRWDGSQGANSHLGAVTTNGLGGLNFINSAIGISVNVLFADQPFDITMQAWTKTGAGITPADYTLSELTLTSPAGVSTRDFFFNSFMGANDFSNVGALQLIVNTGGMTSALDVTIDFLAGTIPEPASLALVGVALLGLGLSRRKSKAV